eukprot:6210144-Pleurochrysis_carterae.AAC.1
MRILRWRSRLRATAITTRSSRAGCSCRCPRRRQSQARGRVIEGRRRTAMRRTRRSARGRTRRTRTWPHAPHAHVAPLAILRRRVAAEGCTFCFVRGTDLAAALTFCKN